MHFALVGTGGPSGAASRAGAELGGLSVIAGLSNDYPVAPVLTPGSIDKVTRALADWGVTMVVLPDQGHLPVYERVPSVVSTAALITAATGTMPFRQSDAWVWSGLAHPDRPIRVSSSQIVRCTGGSTPSTSSPVAAVEAATRCVARHR
jgi:hypothetical protein